MFFGQTDDSFNKCRVIDNGKSSFVEISNLIYNKNITINKIGVFHLNWLQ